ncbi:MAG: hypothetical protein U0271_19825 [Polyangiaceae bacterium]
MRVLRLYPVLAVLASSGVAGCGDDTTTPTPGVCENFNGVCVKVVDTYELDGVTGEKVQDLSSWDGASVLVFDGSSYQEYAGKVFDDGHIEFAGVPEGEYLLRRVGKPNPKIPDAPTPAFFIVSSERVLDLGNYHIGRADAAPLEEAADLTVTGSLPTPWTDIYDENGDPYSDASDTLSLYSRAAGVTGDLYPIGETTDPVAGDTALAWTFDATTAFENSGYGARVVDGAQGDDFTVFRVRDEVLFDAAPPDERWAIARISRPFDVLSFAEAPFTLDPSKPASVTGTFAPVSADKTATFALQWSAFVDAQPKEEGLRLATPDVFELRISAEPGVTEFSVSPDPALAYISVSSESMPTNPTCYPDDQGLCDPVACPDGCDDSTIDTPPSDYALTLNYPDFVGSPHTTISSASTYRVYSLQNPVDDAPDTLLVGSGVTGALDDITGSAVTPRLSPPRSLRIGGQATSATPLEGVGETPVISWDSPASGTARSYFLFLRDMNDLMANDGSVERKRIVAQFRTTATQVTLPPGILQSGHYYTVTIRAADEDVQEGTPNRRGIATIATAMTASGVFAP